jgi:hypothetical protein
MPKFADMLYVTVRGTLGKRRAPDDRECPGLVRLRLALFANYRVGSFVK